MTSPGVQNPHCTASCATNAACTGCSTSPFGESLDRRDLPIADVDGEQHARGNRHAIEPYRAGRARAAIAPDLGSRQPELDHGARRRASSTARPQRGARAVDVQVMADPGPITAVPRQRGGAAGRHGRKPRLDRSSTRHRQSRALEERPARHCHRMPPILIVAKNRHRLTLRQATAARNASRTGFRLAVYAASDIDARQRSTGALATPSGRCSAQDSFGAVETHGYIGRNHPRPGNTERLCPMYRLHAGWLGAIRHTFERVTVMHDRCRRSFLRQIHVHGAPRANLLQAGHGAFESIGRRHRQ